MTVPLSFGKLFQMLSWVCDVMRAARTLSILTCHSLALGHQDAYEKAKVLHRDISAKNIMINPLTKRGLLIDWDLAKHMDTDRGLQSSQSGRSVGTLFSNIAVTCL